MEFKKCPKILICVLVTQHFVRTVLIKVCIFVLILEAFLGKRKHPITKKRLKGSM